MPTPEIREAETPAVEIVAEGLGFPEGPVALADGTVLVVEIGGRALARVHPGGRVERVAHLEGGPNGAAIGPDGWVYVCNSGGWIHADVTMPDGRVLRRAVGQCPRPGWIERVELRGGRVETLYVACDGDALQSPNDLVFDVDGGFYFSDHGKRTETHLGLGSVYYGHADRRPLRRVVGQLITPNGVGLSPDGQTLYVAETATRRLLAFALDGPGRVQPAPWPAPAGGRVLAALPGFNGLDSLAVDAEGGINVASLINGGIWRITPDGSTATHRAIDDPFTTNICFGGADRHSAYVTLSASGRLARLRWPVPGLRLHFNQPLLPASRRE
jgi:gluconolactonase